MSFHKKKQVPAQDSGRVPARRKARTIGRPSGGVSCTPLLPLSRVGNFFFALGCKRGYHVPLSVRIEA